MSNDMQHDFLAPPNYYRAAPFWSWNGLLEKDELMRQIEVCEEMGFGGFFMHSRTGLETEYMGPEWLELINACADEGARRGMETWLYDEDRWPSGTAGGRVTQEPRFRLKFLRCRAVPGTEFQWSEDLIAAFVCELDGFNYSDLRRISSDTPQTDYDYLTVLAFSTEEQVKSTFYNGETYLDTMNREAVDRFIEVTHELYKQHCGERFGSTIKGIFTDEPHRGAIMDGFSLGNRQPHWLAPWTYTVFEDFKERFGYNLVERLPELFLFPDGNEVSQVKWHYVELLQQLFLGNWAKPLDEWCRANNLVLTGHILHEDSLSAQAAMCGSVMRYYEHMEAPGIDILTEGNRNYWVAKQLDSVARQVGRERLLSELDGCTGWQMPFEGHKAIGDWQALFGINLRCPHLSWYTMKGEAKRDFPASIFHQSAWYKEYKLVEDYFARIGVVMSGGKPKCDLLVLNPVESVWCQIYPGWSRTLGAMSEEVQNIEYAYADLFHVLQGAQLDFDYGDEDLIHRLGEVEGGGRLRVGQARYRAVIVSGMVTLRGTTLSLLRKFAEAGGTVIFVGAFPEHVDALPSDAATQFAETCTQVAERGPELVKACEEAVGRHVAVLTEDYEYAADIFCQVKEKDGRLCVMALNINREEWIRNARVHIYGEGIVEEWKCASGERYQLDARPGDGYVEIITDFPPAGEHVYVLQPVRDDDLPALPTFAETSSRELAGPFDYELGELNVCVLDWAEHKVDDEEYAEEMEILQVDREVRQRFSLPFRSGEMLQPWFVKKRGCDVKCRLGLRFNFNVETLPETPVELVLETPEAFTILVNGHELAPPASPDWWVDKCFKRIPLPDGTLQTGANTIELAADFHEAFDIEAIYLVGDFGVSIAGKRSTLVRRPAQVSVESLVEQRLPFYSGPITYKVSVDAAPQAGERVFLSLPRFEGACVKITGNGHEPRLIAWQPYEADVTHMLKDGRGILEVTVILTRRNTFGPLHQVPLLAPSYGPRNFVTTGDEWTDDYNLWPAGLLAPPVISIRG